MSSHGHCGGGGGGLSESTCQSVWSSLVGGHIRAGKTAKTIGGRQSESNRYSPPPLADPLTSGAGRIHWTLWKQSTQVMCVCVPRPVNDLWHPRREGVPEQKKRNTSCTENSCDWLQAINNLVLHNPLGAGSGGGGRRTCLWTLNDKDWMFDKVSEHKHAHTLN